MVMAIIIFAACTKKAHPSQTTTTTTVKTKTTVTTSKVLAATYAVNIQPIIEAKCTPCHIPAKGGNKADLSSYAGAKMRIDDMLVRIQLNPDDRGFMPFKHDKLSDAEIALFKKWQSDGLMEN